MYYLLINNIMSVNNDINNNNNNIELAVGNSSMIGEKGVYRQKKK